MVPQYKHCHVFRFGVCCPAVLLVAIGCSSSGDVERIGGDKPNNLSTLYSAYMQANTRMGRPPKNKEELKPFLPKDKSLGEIMKSAYDGKEFVVKWGFPAIPGPNSAPVSVVFAYEQSGTDGKRWVAMTFGVQQMTDEEFKKAKFAPGLNP